MARYNMTLSLLQSRTILFEVSHYDNALSDRYDIEDATFEIVEKLEKEYPEIFPVDFSKAKKDNPHFSYLAFTFSACAKEGIKRGELKAIEYIAILAEIKEENEQDIHDFGAFGDLYEILIRCAFMRKISLVQWSMLSVKAINKSDIVSSKYGIVEVGHNGKTLSYGTAQDYMNGEYTAMVYGVFSEEDKKEVYKLCKEKEYEKAIDFVCSYSVYWESKYQFEQDMNELTRGKGITLKACGVQVVYNSGKYDAFVSALENEKFVSLYETLKR